MSPTNIQKQHNFWYMSYPFGCDYINARDMIDLDEVGIYPNKVNWKYGKLVAGNRCQKVGTYVRDLKLNTLMDVAGEDDEDDISDRWYDLWEDGGTTNENIYEFTERIINDIGPGTEERRQCFTMDNSNAHLNPIALTLIINSDHRVLFRAPYYPMNVHIIILCRILYVSI